MRAFWMAVALALLASEGAIAAPAIIGKTNMTSDPGHGTQVEYLQAGGGAFLWYPGNAVVLPGHWKMDAGTSTRPAQICFRYGPNTYNPVTHVYGDVWECQQVADYAAVLAEQAKGDVFGLAHRGPVPFVLQHGQSTLEQLAQQAGLQANLGATSKPAPEPPPAKGMPVTAQCQSILAKSHANHAAMVRAAMVYYNGGLLGQACVPVDYQQAFSLLEGAGDTADMTSLWADLKRKAASGNAKARAALSQIGWGH